MKLAVFLVAFFCSVPSFANCILTMGYKESAKLPMIKVMGDNSGAYLDLFTIAAKNIGCKLEVVRLPKKRLHKMFAQGKLDFYPGASFSLLREKYLFYIANGFSTAEYGISHSSMPEVTNYRALATKHIIWVQEVGTSKAEVAKALSIETIVLNNINIEKLKHLMLRRQNSFAVIDKELYEYYLKIHQLDSLQSIGLKVHKKCCSNNQPMYLGFSKFSPHFKSLANPTFNHELIISPKNSRERLTKDSIAYQLSQALEHLEKSGVTGEIYKKYFVSQ